MRRANGFTLVELVTVMMLTGILATVAMPRFMDHTFDERGFRDAVKTAVQHARRVAIASRRYSCVNVTTGAGSTATVSVLRDQTAPEQLNVVGCTAGCVAGTQCTAIALPSPGRGCTATNQVCGPTGVSMTAGASMIFDPLGRLVDSSKNVQAAAVTISISNQTAITVQGATGYVQ